VCAAAFVPSRTAAAEPKSPQFRPEFTAFPDLKPGREMKKFVVHPDGTIEREVIENPGVVLPSLAPLPPDAPLIRKVMHEQARVGLEFLAEVREREWNQKPIHDPLEGLSIAMRVFPLAAELEPRPTNHVMWYEARVRLLKEIERRIRTRVLNGSVPPSDLNQIRFYRLAAEIELLDLLAELKRFEAPPGALRMDPPLPPGPVIAITPEPRRTRPLELAPPPRRAFPSVYTAFPDLVWDSPFAGPGPNRAREDPTARVGLPPTDLPVFPLNAPPSQVVRNEAVLETIAVLDFLSRRQFGLGPGNLDFNVAAEAYRLAADLEPRLSDRVAWYEARVRALKGWVRFIEIRVTNEVIPTSEVHAAQFEHLQTEVDLLRLRARLANAGAVRGDPPHREEIGFGKRKEVNAPPPFTAFPAVQGPVRAVKEVRADGTTVYEWVGMVQRPALPAPRADAPIRQRLRYEQACEGFEYIDRVQQRMLRGGWFEEPAHLIVLADVYRAVAELANNSAERTRWAEHYVRDCKLIEERTDVQTRNGSIPFYFRAFVRAQRLKAEIELLKPQFVAEQSP
jgi:hypothetical protein